MARLLDVALLLAFSLVYVSIVQANYRSWVSRCCVKGQRKASKTNDPSSCNSDDLDRRRFNSQFDRIICRHSERICCVKEIQKMSCQSGKYEASQNRSCDSFRPFVGGDNFRECCDCCALGIKAKTDDSISCSQKLFASSLCVQVFEECCNGTVTQPNPITIPNKPRCSDNFCKQECRDIPNVGAKCYCRTGYQIQSDRVSCRDIDECQLRGDSICGPLEVCVNSPGSYRCVNQTEAACKQGEEKQGGRCIDINECLRGLHRCGRQQTCVNNDGSYTCVCGSGYQASGSSCYDKNECATNEAQCPRYATCVNTEGSYRCECESGRTLRNDKCEDVNECSTGQFSCPQGTRCENTDGSYKCTRISQCLPGQELNAEGQCVAKKFDICAKVQCGSGFVCDPDSPGRPCQDIDECKKVPSSCKPGETCVNFFGTFECRDPCKGVDCGAGLKCESSGRSYSCLDIDECRYAPRKCTGDHEICVNSYGSYSCECRDQFRRNPQTQKCERTNVCTGVNCPSGYRCVVIDRSNFQCKDINECQESPAKCRAAHQRCVNQPGGYYCRCQEGYRLNRSANRCEDIDECTERRSGCNQICENKPGSFVCRCRKGFQLHSDGRTCRDINECVQGTSGCSHMCENTLGSFNCRCRRGYELHSDRRTCRDRNECSSPRCAYRCLNTPGGYRCICPSGYNSTGYYCSDFDECEAGLKCNNDHFCFNTYGSHRCIRKLRCPANYVSTSDKRCDRKCNASDRACYISNKVQRISLWTFKMRSNDPPSRIFSYRIVTYGYRQRPKVNYYFHHGNEEGNFEIITQDENNGVFAYIQNKDRIKGPKIFYLEFRGDVVDSESEDLASRFVHRMYVFVSRYDF